MYLLQMVKSSEAKTQTRYIKKVVFLLLSKIFFNNKGLTCTVCSKRFFSTPYLIPRHSESTFVFTSDIGRFLNSSMIATASSL